MERFHEEQQFRQPWLILLLAAVTALTAWEAAHGMLLPVLLILAVDAFFATARLTVAVNDERLTIRFAPLHRSPRTIPLAAIETAERERYPVIRFGGWGIRFRPGTIAYTVSGRETVRIEREEGRTIYIGTRRPDDLVHALTPE